MNTAIDLINKEIESLENKIAQMKHHANFVGGLDSCDYEAIGYSNNKLDEAKQLEEQLVKLKQDKKELFYFK